MAAQDYYNSGFAENNKPEGPYSGGYGGNSGDNNNNNNNNNRPWTPSSNPTSGPNRPYPQSGENSNYTYGSQPQYPQQSYGGNSPGFSSQSRPPQSNNEYGYSERPPHSNQYGSNQSQPPYPTNDTYPQQSLGQAPYPQGQQDERGLLGALGGGAAGAYAGHQAGHGILGTIGGALSGSVAEDAIKKHRKEKKEKKENEERLEQEQKWGHHQRPPSPSGNYGRHEHHYPAQGNMRGNFSASSNDINLERNNELAARCRAISGQHHRSVIPLNSVLSNRNGSFVWARNGNFGASARHVHLADGGRVLEAELANGHGGWNRAAIRLDERISNKNGHLEFLE